MIDGSSHQESERRSALNSQPSVGTPLSANTAMGGALPLVSETMTATTETDFSNVLGWEQRRIRKSLSRLARQCIQFSHISDFDEALLCAVSRFYGVDVDLDTAETEILEDDEERIRFFPWYLWDFQLPPECALLSPEDYLASQSLTEGEPYLTVGLCFLQEAHLNEFDRKVVHALCESVLTFVEVRDLFPNDGEALVYDYFRKEVVRIFDPSLVGELKPTQLLLVRLVRLQPEANQVPTGLVECVYYVLPGELRGNVQRELERILDGYEEPHHLMKQAGPELLDLAEHLMGHLLETPPAFNRDQEPLVLCRTRLQGEQALELRAILEALPAPFEPQQPDLFTWREDQRLVAQVVFEEDGKCRLEASSRERFERLRHLMQRFGITLPTLHMAMDLERTALNWLQRGQTEYWLNDEEVLEAFQERLPELILNWVSEPHPRLNLRTPLQVWQEGNREMVLRVLLTMRPLISDALHARVLKALA